MAGKQGERHITKYIYKSNTFETNLLLYGYFYQICLLENGNARVVMFNSIYKALGLL